MGHHGELSKDWNKLVTPDNLLPLAYGRRWSIHGGHERRPRWKFTAISRCAAAGTTSGTTWSLGVQFARQSDGPARAEAIFEPPEICPEAYGSYYSHVRYADELIQAIGPERATVFYYEGLQEDFDGEVRRLAAFLEVPLSDAKLQAIREQTNPDGLKNRGAQLFTFRSGTVGDHKKHAEPLAWAQMDQWFEERLGDVPAAQPLRKWM